MTDGDVEMRTWLSSFDKPNLPDYEGIQDRILGGKYCRGDTNDYDHIYRKLLLKETLRSAFDFVDASAEIVRDLLCKAETVFHEPLAGKQQETEHER